MYKEESLYDVGVYGGGSAGRVTDSKPAMNAPIVGCRNCFLYLHQLPGRWGNVFTESAHEEVPPTAPVAAGSSSM